MNFKSIVSAVVFATLLPISAQASQFIDSFDGKFDMSQYLSDNAFGFLPVPIIISEPAVDYGLGMAGLFFHEDDAAAAERKTMMAESESPTHHLLPPSVSTVFGAYTGNDSYMVGGGHFGFFRQGRIRYKGVLGYGDLNLDYYSVDDIELPAPLALNTEALFISTRLNSASENCRCTWAQARPTSMRSSRPMIWAPCFRPRPRQN